MSLSHSLAADVLSRTSSNMLNNATESSRACGGAGSLWSGDRLRHARRPIGSLSEDVNRDQFILEIFEERADGRRSDRRLVFEK